MRSMIIAAFLALGLATAAAAQTSGGAIQVTDAWARATPGMAKTGAAYVTILNKSNVDDRLLSVETPVAKSADVHMTEEKNGVMEMRPAGALPIKAGDKIAFKPGGYHVMLMGLSAPLTAGQTFPLTLVFEKAGKVEAVVKVEKPGAMGPGSMPGMHSMPGMKME